MILDACIRPGFLIRQFHLCILLILDAMNGLAERLEGGGSFNIEVVITPLKDMISTAIMEYHGSSKAISDQVSFSCMVT